MNMSEPTNPFEQYAGRIVTKDGLYSQSEVGLANRNSGILLEMLALDVTPVGMHYLLNHFDVPIIAEDDHVLQLTGAFDSPTHYTLDDIRSLPAVTQAVTLECAGNGRAGHSPRSHSMPWMYEAVGTATWTGTPLAPLLQQSNPADSVVEFSFTGADFGYDKACGHHFARSLTPLQIAELDVLLVYAMNDQPLLPQHGAPLRIIVPGWYGMASVKWLTEICALNQPFEGFQQVRTYQYRDSDEDQGRPIQTMRVKSLMVPPGVPDWSSRKRLLDAGPVRLVGRAWSGGGTAIKHVEVLLDNQWQPASLTDQTGAYAWQQWSINWMATSGHHTLRCRATDALGNVQPLEPPWDVSGFANNAAQKVEVFVAQA